MIEYRSFVPMNPDREEINELEHSPFNLHANEETSTAMRLV